MARSDAEYAEIEQRLAELERRVAALERWRSDVLSVSPDTGLRILARRAARAGAAMMAAASIRLR